MQIFTTLSLCLQIMRSSCEEDVRLITQLSVYHIVVFRDIAHA
jgi:hypothetical protein